MRLGYTVEILSRIYNFIWTRSQVQMPIKKVFSNFRHINLTQMKQYVISITHLKQFFISQSYINLGYYIEKQTLIKELIKGGGISIQKNNNKQTKTNTIYQLFQFRPPIALRTDLSHISTELWEIPVLRGAH